ncbi:hypothetical protein ABBQ32_006621 [Trebouxia sp. C0010 RCD-2024]
MQPSLVTAAHDRKRKREDLVPTSNQCILPALHTSNPASTLLAPEDTRVKRQHVLSAPLSQTSNSLSRPQRESSPDQQHTFSG